MSLTEFIIITAALSALVAAAPVSLTEFIIVTAALSALVAAITSAMC